MKEQLKKLLSGIAPIAAAALGASNPVAALAIKAISTQFTGSENSPEDTIISKVKEAIQRASTDPIELSKIKEFDQNFRLEMRRLDIDEFELGIQAVAEARTMAQHFNRLDAYLGITFIVFVMYLFFCLGTFYMAVNGVQLSDDQIMLQGRMFGTAEGLLLSAAAFWFGEKRRNNR